MATVIVNWIGSGRIERKEGRQELAQSESAAIDARISVYPLGEHHPLAHLAGIFEDEPLWDEFMQAIQEYREETNEQENIEE